MVLGTHGRPPGSTRRKVGTTSSHHAPYVLGCTRATMAGTMSCDTARWSESQKAGLSSDWGLQLDPMKSESLVIADQHHHAPYVLGCTRATMAGTMSCDTARWSESQKAGLSSDWGLQLDPMKSESLVIADQHCCGEYVPGPCTHRPSRHESR